MKQKITSTLNILITVCLILFFISGCKKNDLQTLQTIKPSESQTISKINAWLDKKMAVTANQRSTDRTLQDIIQSVKDNLDFSKLRYEELSKEEKLVIVPIKKDFKSLNNQGKNPINVEVVGNIRKVMQSIVDQPLEQDFLITTLQLLVV